MPAPRKGPSIHPTLGGALAVLLLAVLALVYRAATGGSPAQARPGSGQTTPAQPGAAGWYTVYFTDPNGPNAKTLRGGPDLALAQAIQSARLSVDAAIFDLNLWSVRDALIAAHRAGVTVRLVVDSDNLDEPEIREIIEAGIPVLGDRQEPLMHNKFVVIDSQEVWTGSMNFTITDAYKNDNNMVRVRATRLAENYTAEFEEMFVQDLFGPAWRANTPNPSITVEGIQVETLFSPDDGAADRIEALIGQAEESVFFLAYSFTSDELASALQERIRAGVQVSGVMEASQVASNVGGEYSRLLEAGADVRLDGNSANMHHKVMIIDEQIVITGSYNFSANAEDRNDENVLIFHDPQIAGQFLAEFQRVYNTASQ